MIPPGLELLPVGTAAFIRAMAAAALGGGRIGCFFADEKLFFGGIEIRCWWFPLLLLFCI